MLERRLALARLPAAELALVPPYGTVDDAAVPSHSRRFWSGVATLPSLFSWNEAMDGALGTRLADAWTITGRLYPSRLEGALCTQVSVSLPAVQASGVECAGPG